MAEVSSENIFETMIRMDHKELFVDLKQNALGVYLKLSERNGKSRSTVLIPASGIGRLISVLQEISTVLSSSDSSKTRALTAPKTAVMAPGTEVFISGLAWSTTEEALRAHFAKINGIQNVTILRKTRGTKILSLGCAVVQFSSVDDASAAMTLYNDTELEGRRIRCRANRGDFSSTGARSNTGARVGFGADSATAAHKLDADAGGTHGALSATGGPVASTSGDPPRVLDPTKVFVTSLSWVTTEATLMEFFSQVGPVATATILSSKKGGRSLGHGIVEFTNPAATQLAIETLNKQELDGRIIVVREYYLS